MLDLYNDGIFTFFDHWFLQPQIPHCLESGVQSFADVLVRGIRKFIDDAHKISIPSKSFFQNILGRDVCGEPSWTFYLDAIVENSHVNIVSDRVVAVKHSVGDYLMQRFGGIRDLLQSLGPENLYFANNFLRYSHSLLYQVIRATLNADGIVNQHLARSLRIAGLVSVYFYPTSLR